MLNFLAALAIFCGGWWLISKLLSDRSAEDTTGAPQRHLNINCAFAWPAQDHFDVEVVGESFYQAAIAAAAGTHDKSGAQKVVRAALVPEKNAHDRSAVAVFVDGYKVGHLSREDARSYRRRLKKQGHGEVAAEAQALICGGGTRNGEKLYYGVFLALDSFD